MLPITEIINSEIDYKDEVLELSKQATDYLQSFNWCEKIKNGWLIKDWGYIFCVFYFEIIPHENSDADNFVWIIVGDIPPAYIDIQSAAKAYDAVDYYIYLMQNWIDNIQRGLSVDDCYPIAVPPTIEYADMLQTRINIIKEDMLPEMH